MKYDPWIEDYGHFSLRPKVFEEFQQIKGNNDRLSANGQYKT